MIHRNVLIRHADRDGVTARTVERDYVLAQVLTAIARIDRRGRIVFKGGTALRLCHFDSYRYSADLDFSVVGGLGSDGARRLVADALADCKERIGIPVLRLGGDTPPRVEYVGPLEAKSRSLKLDLADDELVENTVALPIACRYSDQEPHDCVAYTLEEVAAEKLRCVIQRLQCRDLYDLYELLVVRGVDAGGVWPLFERKTRHRGIDPEQFAGRFDDRQPEWRRRWEDELTEYVSDPLPQYESAVRAVRRELRSVLR